jgi:hypothetical protein
MAATAGTTYYFKVRALNAFSIANNKGTLSDPFTIIAAIKAEKLSSVTTANVGTNVVIQWTETSDAHSSPVTSYTITIKTSGSTPSWEPDTTHCNGATYNVWVNRQCTIPMSVFRASPYTLGPNVLIEVVVTATNGVGENTASDANTVGARVKNIP